VTRGLTDEEAALVRAWARRRRRTFLWLMPLVVPACTIGLAVALMTALDHEVLLTLLMVANVVGVPLLTWTMFWRPGRELATVAAGHPVRRMHGRFRVRFNRGAGSPEINDAPVAFASRELRRKVELDAQCTVEVVFDSPALVIRVL
jgi:hypothetical protein